MTGQLSDTQLLLLDVDGVLTDGTITYTDSGEQIKRFNAKDGLGLRLLMDAGIKVGIITGRSSQALVHRCRDLKIDLIFQGTIDKSKALDAVRTETGIDTDRIAFVGDDLIDLPVMTRVGIPICVFDALPDVKKHAIYVTDACGGKGAVREICEKILKAKGLWETILARYLP